MRRTAVGLLLAALALAACGQGGGGDSADRTGEARLINVTGNVLTKRFQRSGTVCMDKAVDLHGGSTVVVSSTDGTPLGDGRVSVGRVEGDVCRFGFQVDGVAAGRGDYVVAVAGADHVTLSEAQLHRPVVIRLP